MIKINQFNSFLIVNISIINKDKSIFHNFHKYIPNDHITLVNHNQNLMDLSNNNNLIMLNPQIQTSFLAVVLNFHDILQRMHKFHIQNLFDYHLYKDINYQIWATIFLHNHLFDNYIYKTQDKSSYHLLLNSFKHY